MKRIFAAAAALALVCILAACGTGSPAPEGGTTTPMDENKAAGTVTIPVPEETGDTPDDTLGALTGGTYTNKTARITCKLDDSWLFYNERQLEELNGVLTEAGGGDVAALAESGKAVYDMYAVSTDGLMTMNVTYQNLGLLSGASMTAQEYVEWAAQTLPGDLAACGLTDVAVQIAAQDIAAERPHAAGDGAAAGHAHVRADGVHPVRRLHLLRDAVQLHGGRDGGHGRPVPPGVVKMAQKKEAPAGFLFCVRVFT